MGAGVAGGLGVGAAVGLGVAPASGSGSPSAWASQSAWGSRSAWGSPARLGSAVPVGLAVGFVGRLRGRASPSPQESVAVGPAVGPRWDRRWRGLCHRTRLRHRDDHRVVPVTQHERRAAALDGRRTLERIEEGRLLGHDIVGAGQTGGREAADPHDRAVGPIGPVVPVAASRAADAGDPEHRGQLGPSDRDRLGSGRGGARVHDPRPSSGLLGAASKTRIVCAARAEDRECVDADAVEAAVVEHGQVVRLERHDGIAARLLGREALEISSVRPLARAMAA